jgi:redox-sensitive bicupin YhaK (pirin superfamily)
MIRTIPSTDRYHTDAGWLDARWHFSFSDYHDPANMNFGPLRVFNDDVVQPSSGFDMHPHREMEIVTYVIDGELEHRDHLGHRGLLKPGDVQVMSAGRGIMHSEKNPSDTTPVHLNQIWIMPRNRGNTPRYDQKAFDASARLNTLMPVVSSNESNGPLTIDQDATLYISTIEPGKALEHAIAPGRRAYLFVIRGAGLLVNGTTLGAGDQARIEDESALTIEAAKNANVNTDLILIDLP